MCPFPNTNESLTLVVSISLSKSIPAFNSAVLSCKKTKLISIFF